MNADQITAIERLSHVQREALKPILRRKGVDLLSLPVLRRPPELQQLPLSHAQQRLWILHEMDPVSAAFNVPVSLRVIGELDRQALQAAFDALLRRHESLRTRFARHDGKLVQVVEPVAQISLECVPLAHLDEPERGIAMVQHMLEEARRPFDLSLAPLLRGGLLDIGAHEHVLLITLHHIVADTWSVTILMRELAALYAVIAQGAPCELAPVRIQYGDFAYWQRVWLEHAGLDRQLAYWRQRLQGLPGPLALPRRADLPAQSVPRGATLRRTLDSATTRGLQALALEAQATLFMVMGAAWSILLWRYSGQSSLCFVTPVAERPRVELESCIGCFIQTLVLRCDLAEDMSFLDLLAQLRRTTLDAFAHQDAPLEQVIDALGLSQEAGRACFLQVMLTLQNAPQPTEVSLPGLNFELLTRDGASAKVELSLNVQHLGDPLHLEFEYRADLFDEPDIERMADNLISLLRAAVANAGARIGQLPLADDEAFLAAWRDLPPVPAPLDVLAALAEQVRLRGTALALQDHDRELSHAELDAWSSRLAQALRQRGVGPGVRVGVGMGRCIEFVVSILAVLKAGGAYVPLDPDYPPQRLADMLDDSQPRLLLSAGAAAPTLRAVAGDRALLDVKDLAAADALQACAPSAPAGADDVAYVIYTSGSTGRPKGVEVTHGNLGSYCRSAMHLYELGVGDRMLHASSISFDLAIEEIFTALVSGATLVLLASARLAGIAEFQAQLLRDRISVASLPTAYWHEWMAQGEAFDARVCEALRLLIVGGERASQHRLLQWRERTGGRVAWLNTYGPTETTVIVTAGAARADGSVGIGRPLPSARVYLLDDAGRPVPLGASGEIYIGGAQVARGYLHQPELTAQRFVHDPFSATAGARMYRSGDLARLRVDGSLDYVGRVDRQAKIRGHRVEPDEVTAVLLGMSSVRDAVSVVRTDAHEEARLWSFVVLQDEAALDGATLRRALTRELPRYLVPAVVMCLAALPLTPNGKLDLDALPLQGAGLDAHARAPSTQLQRQIALLWCELLGRESVGLDDNFFEIGGHSLLALRLGSRLTQALGREVPAHLLFAHPTLEGLALALEPANPAAASPLLPIRPGGTLEPLFIVHGGDGEVGYARAIAGQLQPERPVYALVASGLLAGTPPPDSVDAMARQYLQAIRAVAPRGRLHMLGWSAGGCIVHEMAAQLQGQGCEPGFTGLIDTPWRYLADPAGALPSQADTLLLYLRGQAGDELTASLMTTLQPLAERGDVAAMLQACQADGLIAADIDMPTLLRHIAVRHAISCAVLRHSPSRLHSRLWLFSAADEKRDDPTLGWRSAHGGPLHWQSLPGTHWTLVQPGSLQALAAAVTAALPAEQDAS